MEVEHNHVRVAQAGGPVEQQCDGPALAGAGVAEHGQVALEHPVSVGDRERVARRDEPVLGPDIGTQCRHEPAQPVALDQEAVRVQVRQTRHTRPEHADPAARRIERADRHRGHPERLGAAPLELRDDAHQEHAPDREGDQVRDADVIGLGPAQRDLDSVGVDDGDATDRGAGGQVEPRRFDRCERHHAHLIGN